MSIAEDMINGVYCHVCGEYLGEDNCFEQICEACKISQKEKKLSA